jgi:sulfate adenylyltransferase subunit 1
MSKSSAFLAPRAKPITGGRTLLRLATAGSVDDGKSTLVGRLLFDTNSVLIDTLDHVERVSKGKGLHRTDLALLTDGLRAEREQGITIDVAYRYFATPVRKFILADCPGHVQYTRNTVTGSSTADVIVLLVDARKGVVEQTRRHLAVASLLRVPHVVLVVNKIDLVDYSGDVFTAIATDFALLARSLGVGDLLHPGLSDRGRQRGRAIAPHSLVRRTDRTELPGEHRRHASRCRFRSPVPGAARRPTAVGIPRTMGRSRAASQR